MKTTQRQARHYRDLQRHSQPMPAYTQRSDDYFCPINGTVRSNVDPQFGCNDAESILISNFGR